MEKSRRKRNGRRDEKGEASWRKRGERTKRRKKGFEFEKHEKGKKENDDPPQNDEIEIITTTIRYSSDFKRNATWNSFRIPETRQNENG